MKNINEFIKDYFIQEELAEIDANIVCESFNCQLLKDLAKQLKDQKDNEKKKNDEEYKAKLKEYEENGWGKPYHDTHTYSQNFKQIFGGYYGNIEWYKVKDDDISKIPASEDVNKKADKDVRDVLKGKKDAIILIKDKDDKNFEYVIFNWGNMFALKENGYRSHAGSRLGSGNGRSWRDLSQKDKIELCQNKNLYFIDTTNLKVEWSKKHNDRYNQKQGIIMFDPESLSRIAQENIKRYKEIIRKNQANRINNDALFDECEKIIKRASELATEVAKNPVVNADLIEDVSNLSLWIYDKQYSEYSKWEKKYVTRGVPGILPLMVRYSRLVKDLSKDGGYSHQQDELKGVISALNKAVAKGKEIIEKIEEKM